MPDICLLRVNSKIYGGWKQIEIQRGIEQMSGQFSLQVTEHWPGSDTPRQILPGMACAVEIDGIPVVTGYINGARPGFDASNVWFACTGKDKSGDLVKCSAVYKSGQWKNATVERIITDLITPFGIRLIVGERGKAAASSKLASFAVEEGELVHDTIERLLRLKAVMIWTDGSGNLILDLPGTAKATTALVEGENLLYAEAVLSDEEQHSEYIVKGQAKGKHNGKGTAKDSGVGRYLPLVVLAEDQAKGVDAKKRAEWERTVRQGRGKRFVCKVQSWRQGGDNGPLWVPGLRVFVESPRIRLRGEMLIVSVRYIKSETDGTRCELEISDPRAFDRLSGVTPPALKRVRKASDKGLGTGSIETTTGNQKNKDDGWGPTGAKAE
jgi:prophage tail gpP-like protein